MLPLQLSQPYLLYLGDIHDAPFAKTAYGLRDWAPERCIGEYVVPGGSVTAGLPQLTMQEAAARGARGVVIGVTPIGGVISRAWIPSLVEALECGLDIISGMHTPLSAVPELKAAADRLGRRLIDVRRPPDGLPIGTGRKRTGKRLLTVGTDCALGKKYTALALARAFKARGVDADFRATGQTGVLIAGGGIAIDSVVADFLAGAAELLSPDAARDHWDVIEGQGSLLHPAYAGVSTGLLHGSQPDVFVVCHEPGREHLSGFPEFRVPPIEDVIELTLALGRRVNPAIRCAGISMNTSKLGDEAARARMQVEGARLGLPCGDPIRGGPAFEQLVDACLAG